MKCEVCGGGGALKMWTELENRGEGKPTTWACVECWRTERFLPTRGRDVGSAADRFCARVDLRTFPVPVRLAGRDDGPLCLIQVSLLVPDSYFPDTMTTISSSFRSILSLGEETTLKLLEARVRGGLWHELDEHLKFDGRRVFDPHDAGAIATLTDPEKSRP